MIPSRFRVCETFLLVCCLRGPSTSSAHRVEEQDFDEDVLDVEDLWVSRTFSVSPTCLSESNFSQGAAERNFIDDLKNLTILPTWEQQEFLIPLGSTMPKVCHTSATFKWLGQRLLYTQGLASVTKEYIAGLMNRFDVYEHLGFLKTDPGHYAFFLEVTCHCVLALEQEMPNIVAMKCLVLGYMKLVKFVSKSGDILALKYPQMTSDAAELFVRLAPILGASMVGKEMLQPAVKSSLQRFFTLEDAFDWYLKLLHSYPSSKIESAVMHLLWRRLLKIVPDPDEFLMTLRQGGFFYAKLPLTSFYFMLGNILRIFHHRDLGVHIFQDLVHLVKKHSSEVMPEDDIDRLGKCANLLGNTENARNTILRGCQAGMNRSTAFALSVEVGVLGKLAAYLPDADEKPALVSQMLDVAGELRGVFDGFPSGLMISNAWQIIKSTDDQNKSMSVLTNHSHFMHRVMGGLHHSKHDRLYETYLRVMYQVCATSPGTIMREAPDSFERIVETISGRQITCKTCRSPETMCIESLATQLPCQVLEAYPSAAKRLLELMRGHVDENCTDTPGFKDSLGYTCKNWESFAFSCKEQALFEVYDWEEAEAIASNCKASCRSCITEAVPKFSTDQSSLGLTFRKLTACKSSSFIEEVEFILASVKSFGQAASEVMQSVSKIIERNPGQFLKTGIMSQFHSLVSQRWTDVVSKEDVRKWILESVNVLIKEAEHVSRSLEDQNAELSAMKDDVTDKNSQLEVTTQSLSHEKEALTRIAKSQERFATLSRHFSEQARRQVPCQDQFCTIPSGWTVNTLNDSYDLAKDDIDVFVRQNMLYRCPNRDACNGDRKWDTSSRSSLGQRMCAKGYRGGSHGCAQCEEDHGRAQFDPFLCRKCAPLGLASAQYMLPPLVIFATGLAFANAEPTTAGSLLNILLSFSLTAHCISTPIASTRMYKEVKANVSSFVIQLLELPEAGAESVGFGHMSYDCIQRQFSLSDHLAGETGFIWTWLAFDACIPFALLLSSLVLNFIIRIFSPGMSLTRILVLPMLVFGNSFLPKLFGASLRSYPCVHETLGPEQSMAYALDMPCSLYNTLPMAAVCATICCCVGPVFWAIMFRRSHAWTQACRKETLGYLSVDYREEYQWWEILVLLRKMSLAAVNTLWPASYAPSSHSLFCHLVVGMALILHCLHYPYKSNFLNRVEIGALMSAFLAMTGAQYVTVEEEWTHTYDDSLLLMLFTYITLIVTFVILVGLWIYTFLVEMGVLRGFGPETTSAKEEES